MSTTLWIHHWQSMWSAPARKRGLPPEEFGRVLNNLLRRRKFHTVLLTMFDDYRVEDFHWDYCPRLCNHPGLVVHEFGYGWCCEDREALEEQGVTDVEWVHSYGSSQIVPLQPWLKDLLLPRKKGDTVLLAGMFDGECLADARAVLEHLSVEHDLFYDLIC